MGVSARNDDLAARVARLDLMARHVRSRDLLDEVDAIRCVAEAAGVLPVVAVARALEAALGRGESGVIVRGWIAMLGEAVGCGQTDAQSGHVFLAAGAVRLAG
ncbi:MAG TPA: hypothetical protein VF409_11840 [Sphingomonas sp.]